MRYLLILALALTHAAVAAGQGVPAPNPAAAAAAAVKAKGYLSRWEQAMEKIQTLQTKIERKEVDNTFKKTTTNVGYAQYMKSGKAPYFVNQAVLSLNQPDKKEIADKYICTGNYIFQFAVAQKEIRAYEVPRPKPGQVADTSLLSLMFGMKAEDALKRYHIDVDPKDAGDANYVYLNVYPRFAADKADFKAAQIVLNRATFLPRRLWFQSANGDTNQWDMDEMKAGVTIDPRTFDAPRTPAGWKFVPVPKPGDNKPAPAGGTGVPPVKARP